MEGDAEQLPALVPLTTTTTTTQGKKPTVCIVIGTAGSGKTTLMQRLNAQLHAAKKSLYVLNLDPAVRHVPYGVNIDIRDTVKYKEVMKQYSLGPNGAIMTSLNLFATRFDQVVSLIEKRASTLDYVLVDTPGQIEVFTWSASGSIIAESLASAFPTVLVFVIDTPRTANPTTFMSNLLYACSILYKFKLPFILTFNKTDVLSHDFAVRWMTDFNSFLDAVNNESSYMSSLTRSMSMVLDEFYSTLTTVGVSAMSGAGIDDFFKAVDAAGVEYERDYKIELQRRAKAKEDKEKQRQAAQLRRLKHDIEQAKSGTVILDTAATHPAAKRPAKARSPAPTRMVEEEEEQEDDVDAEIDGDQHPRVDPYAHLATGDGDNEEQDEEAAMEDEEEDMAQGSGHYYDSQEDMERDRADLEEFREGLRKLRVDHHHHTPTTTTTTTTTTSTTSTTSSARPQHIPP
eukprot:TRINITY_DN5740_c0_g1_i1.p1 TRINITY_DN5740_c0_g1~~TRINITY_DN5740_c0_g1_i1.p1  ORF type:complete len:458 (-),score=119.53 TRINITY_DN5740_c0_g1_i1:19-1392(-)